MYFVKAEIDGHDYFLQVTKEGDCQWNGLFENRTLFKEVNDAEEKVKILVGEKNIYWDTYSNSPAF